MKIISFSLLFISLLIANDISDRFATPRSTFDTFIDAVLDKDKDLALLCFSVTIRNEIAQEWEDEELPDSIWYEITSEEIDEDAAVIEVTMWDDLTDREVDEMLWFVLEEDGWKIVFEPPDQSRGSIDTTEK